jgi:hypothetical protein
MWWNYPIHWIKILHQILAIQSFINMNDWLSTPFLSLLLKEALSHFLFWYPTANPCFVCLESFSMIPTSFGRILVSFQPLISWLLCSKSHLHHFKLNYIHYVVRKCFESFHSKVQLFTKYVIMMLKFNWVFHNKAMTLSEVIKRF